MSRSITESFTKKYRTYVKVHFDGLWLMGTLRFVLMEAAKFVHVVNALHYEGNLGCPSTVLAEALDCLHEQTFAEDLPEDEDWMANLMIKAIRDGTERKVDLFPAPRPPLPKPSS